MKRTVGIKSVLAIALLAWVSISVAMSAGEEQVTPAPAAAPAPREASRPAPPVERATQAAVASAASTQQYKALIDRYCVGCHNDRTKTPAADPLYLDKVDINDLVKDAEVWERVIRKLAIGAMPPQGMPRPEAPAMAAFVNHVTTTLDRAADAANNPGTFELHRLNRAEYANAIRDLLNVEIDVTGLLPPDSSDFGFDNIASALTVTPGLLERYLTAAVRISAIAVGDRQAEPTEERFPVRLDVTQNGHIEGLPLGTRGGTVVGFNFPVDGDYLLSGSLFRPVDNADSGIEGQEIPNQFVILIDGVPVHSALIGGPTDHVASRQNMTAAREIVGERMKARVSVTAGYHEVGFTFAERPARSQDVFEPSLRGSQDIHVGSERPKLNAVSIAGPLTVKGLSDTPSRRRLFTCTPASGRDEERCAQQILSTVARRAYRRPVTDTDMQPVMAFYRRGRTGADFESGIRAALPRILSSPSFIFRSEKDPAALPVNASHPVSDLELASRLSFFLWSSIPDDELLNLAAANRLRAPGVLAQQVRRMLADERSRALTSNFPGQWLALRNIEKASPDLLGFPDWDDNLRQSMVRETELFFDSLVRDDRSLLDLLNADYTFVNERLARHYGIPGVYGTDFRRVQVQDPNRRGLLGQGSILTVTSVATRTSPVFRGKYILTTLLGQPAPVPPPNVPALPENGAAAAPKSVRQRLETHRNNPVCASCHRSLDPLGFALENFNAVGQWIETTEAGTPVDASGVLADGTAVDSPQALRRALSSRPDVFAGTVTERLLTYALGRGLRAYDMPVVRDIVRDSAKGNYRMGDVIEGIVQSRPFQMRRKLAQDDTE